MRFKKSKDKLIERELFPILLKWLKEKEIMIINGPRQAGKTTILFQLKEVLSKENVVYIDFEEIENLENFLRSPKEFVLFHLDKKRRTYFLFDEFQYVKNGGKILKLLFDSFPQAKFIISGSSSLKIREIASYLVGRAIFFHLYPFSFAEFLRAKDELLFNLWRKNHQFLINFVEKENFSKIKSTAGLIFEEKLKSALEEYLIWGGYPAIVLSKKEHKKERLINLVETYIEKDIIRFLRIGNFLEFKNLLKVLSIQLANILNFSSLSSDTKLSFYEIKKFLGILENTFVTVFVSPFFSNRTTEIKKSPKVYFLDLGLRNSLIFDYRLLEIRQDRGAIIENFVFQNLYFRKNFSQIYFWRTKQQAEVDFILRWENEIIAVEVKDQEFDKPRLSRSFISFLEKYQPKKGIIFNRNYFAQLSFEKTKILFLPYYFV